MQSKPELKQKAIEMRKQGISIIKIGKDLGVAKSSVSVWTQSVILTDEQKNELAKHNLDSLNENRLLANISRSNTYRRRRIVAQERGKEKIKLNDPLYVAGCMLYWGEGSKKVNKCEMVNSELSMLIIFKKFLFSFFDLGDADINISINAYTDCHSEDEIKKYWMNGLELPESCLKYTLWNQYPISSRKKKIRKSEYGTCALGVHKTEVIQEIFGAIQEFGHFTNEKWLG